MKPTKYTIMLGSCGEHVSGEGLPKPKVTSSILVGGTGSAITPALGDVLGTFQGGAHGKPSRRHLSIGYLRGCLGHAEKGSVAWAVNWLTKVRRARDDGAISDIESIFLAQEFDALRHPDRISGRIKRDALARYGAWKKRVRPEPSAQPLAAVALKLKILPTPAELEARLALVEELDRGAA